MIELTSNREENLKQIDRIRGEMTRLTSLLNDLEEKVKSEAVPIEPNGLNDHELKEADLEGVYYWSLPDTTEIREYKKRDSTHRQRVKSGNFFPSKEDASRVVNRINSLMKIWKAADSLNKQSNQCGGKFGFRIVKNRDGILEWVLVGFQERAAIGSVWVYSDQAHVMKVWLQKNYPNGVSE